MPDASMKTVDYLPIPIFEESVAGISHEKKLNSEQILAVIPRMEQLYYKMVTDSSCRENLGRAARSVMEHDFSKGSVLWHCTEGKDRCGLLSAVLLLALGMKRSTIMEDYLDAAFSAMDAQYKKTDAFLHDGRNISQKLIERFQSSVL